MSNCMKKRRVGNKKIIIGLTGSFGSGKTTVARFLKNRGARVVDADRISRSLLNPDSPVYRKVTAAFGASILDSRRRINRKKLASMVFSDKRPLVRLNGIIHPEVVRIIKDQADRSDSKIVVIDAPLLIEAGLRNWVDKLIVVKISKKEQFRRLWLRTRLKKEDIENRIKAQMPLSRKVRLADFIIDNNGTVAWTKEQAERIWEKIMNTPR